MMMSLSIFVTQEIDDLLSGGLSDEDNDAILKELDELSEVSLLLSCFYKEQNT